jgi:hypothetical protein
VKRTVSWRELSLWAAVYLVAVALALALLLAMLSVPAHADADKRVIQKHDTWSSIRSYQAPDNVGFGTHTESYTVTTVTYYLWWPDGSNANKVAPVSRKVCYHRNTGNGSLFQGVNSSPLYTDSTTVIGVTTTEVPDDDTADNCVTDDIALSNRSWLRMDQNARWQNVGKVRIKFSQDDNFDYRWGGQLVKYFEPGADPNDGDWFYCECDYGGAGH